MSAKVDDFPLCHPGQMPSDDLGTARLMLQAVEFAMSDGRPLPSAEAQALYTVLAAAIDKLSVLQLFLDDCNCPNEHAEYMAARRLWILQNGGAK